MLGEGEQPIVDLVSTEFGAPTDHIDNISGNAAQANYGPARPASRHLIIVPFMTSDLDEPNGTVHMTTQRGCPLARRACTTSCTPTGGEDYGRRRWHANVLAELRAPAPIVWALDVIFLDDTFSRQSLVGHGLL